jgi:hypothetical protein
MKKYLISYDLGLPETRDDYRKLISYIKSLELWANPLKSVWLVQTNKTAKDLRDELKNATDSNDSILVIEVNDHWATSRITKEVTDWMQEYI